MNERQLALSAFSDIIRRGAYANLRLEELDKDMPQRPFVYALVYTALEHLVTIDYLLDACTEKRRMKPLIRDILRLGMTELLYMDEKTHAVVNEYVELTKKSGKRELAGFVNAILRRIDRERDTLSLPGGMNARSLSIRYSIPEWIIAMWQRDYPSHAASMLSHGKQSTCIRAQYPYHTGELETVLTENEAVYRRGTMDPDAIHVESGFDPVHTDLYRTGRIAIQGEAAMLASRALSDMAGANVLDACSAPGGKSACLYSLLSGNVRLTCWDIHPHRTDLIRAAFERLHVQAEIAVHDASLPDDVFFQRFDAVLVDAPCSGLGLVHQKPDLRYRVKETDIAEIASVQAKILDTVSSYVKPGGILVYATCTVSRQENECQVRSFLGRHPEFCPDSLPFVKNGGNGPVLIRFQKETAETPGVTSMDDSVTLAGYEISPDGSAIQLFPAGDGTEGFYIARLKKCIS